MFRSHIHACPGIFQAVGKGQFSNLISAFLLLSGKPNLEGNIRRENKRKLMPFTSLQINMPSVENAYLSTRRTVLLQLPKVSTDCVV